MIIINVIALNLDVFLHADSAGFADFSLAALALAYIAVTRFLRGIPLFARDDTIQDL